MKSDLGFGAEEALPKAIGTVERWTSKRLFDLAKECMTEVKYERVGATVVRFGGISDDVVGVLISVDIGTIGSVRSCKSLWFNLPK